MVASAAGMGYDCVVPASAGAGVDSPKQVRRAGAIRQASFFMPVTHHGGLRGEAERSAGCLTGRSVNPAQIRHHLFDSSVGGLRSQLGARIMAARQSSALPNTPITKQCSKCGKEKLLAEFTRDQRKRLGVRCSCKACDREWRLSNQEYMSTYLIEWRKRNQGYANIAIKKWRADNPEKEKAIKNNRRARKLNSEGSHTAADIQQILVLQKGKYAVCHAAISIGYHVDHIVPLALNGGNSKYNLQLLCQHCNLSKHAKHPVDFMQSRGMLL